MPGIRQRRDLGGGALAQPGQHRVQEPVRRCLRAGARRFPRDRRRHRFAGQRERHVPQGGDAPGERGQRAAPEVVHPERLRPAGRLGQRGAHQVHVRVDAAGEDQQAAGVKLVPARHGPAELRDAAIPHPQVGSLLPVRGDEGPAPDDELESGGSHPGIVARRGRLRAVGPAAACRTIGCHGSAPAGPASGRGAGPGKASGAG
ncbi:MAG: hypothetical protein LBI49_18715 [Nocardiopsaceae bacterium]|jgi:hypothetical protein|nr:hypothetical protein [Nocardiopsaceae bacterium]